MSRGPAGGPGSPGGRYAAQHPARRDPRRGGHLARGPRRAHQPGRPGRGLALRYEHTAVARWLKGQRPRGPGARPDLRGARGPAAPAGHPRRHRPRRAGRAGRPARHPALRFRRAGHRAVALRRAAAPAHPRRARGHRHARPSCRCGSGRTRPRTSTSPAAAGTGSASADIEMLRAARAHYEQMYRKAGGIATRSPHRRLPQRRGGAAAARQLQRRDAAVNCTGRPAGWSRSPGSARTTRTRTAWPSATSTRRCGWQRPAGTGDSGAYVIALLVNQSLFMREYRQAVAFAEAALRAAGPADHPGARRRPVRDAGQGVRPPRRRQRARCPASGVRRRPPSASGAGTSPTRPAMSSRAWSTSRWRRRCSASATWRPPREHADGRRRHPGARPRPGAPARHAQPDRAAPGQRGPGGGHRGRRWPSRPGAWSRSGCGTGCGRCANIWCAAAARARPRRPNSSTGHCAYPDS